MFANIYRGFLREPEKLVERGSFRGRSRFSHPLVKVHDHVRYFLVLRGPDLDAATRRDLLKAQDKIERSLGCIPLPPEGLGPSDCAAGHLASAKALCDEYIPRFFPRREATVGRLVRRSCLREAGAARASKLPG